MNSEFHTWVSVYVALTSTQDKHFKLIHLTEVHWNIDTTNQTINKIIWAGCIYFHTNIHLTSVANMFACFQLYIYDSFCSLKKFKPGFHIVSCKINDGWIFLTTILRCYRIKNWGNEFYFAKYYFIILHNKTTFKKINMQTVLMKCGILLNI